MDILDKAESSLKAEYIIIEKINFSRKDCEIPPSKLSIKPKKKIEAFDGKYKVTFSLDIVNEEKTFELSVAIAGLFKFSDDFDKDIKNEKEKEEIINTNTISILFPFLRSEVTLITAQPYFQSIVLPPININRLLTDMETE